MRPGGHEGQLKADFTKQAFERSEVQFRRGGLGPGESGAHHRVVKPLIDDLADVDGTRDRNAPLPSPRRGVGVGSDGSFIGLHRGADPSQSFRLE